MKLYTVNGSIFENRIKSVIKNAGKVKYSEDDKANILLVEIELKKTIQRILENSILA